MHRAAKSQGVRNHNHYSTQTQLLTFSQPSSPHTTKVPTELDRQTNRLANAKHINKISHPKNQSLTKLPAHRTSLPSSPTPRPYPPTPNRRQYSSDLAFLRFRFRFILSFLCRSLPPCLHPSTPAFPPTLRFLHPCISSPQQL